jgi:hypothetical protein
VLTAPAARQIAAHVAVVNGPCVGVSLHQIRQRIGDRFEEPAEAQWKGTSEGVAETSGVLDRDDTRLSGHRNLDSSPR